MRLIDPLELKRSISASVLCGDGKHIFDIIDEQPTIEERKKGKWLVYEVANDEDEHPIAWECDACGAVVDCKTKFCPECGQEKEV